MDIEETWAELEASRERCDVLRQQLGIHKVTTHRPTMRLVAEYEHTGAETIDDVLRDIGAILSSCEARRERRPHLRLV